MKLTLKHFFDAAHQLKDGDYLATKACARLHGHTYAVIVVVNKGINEGGMIVDFKIIKDIINELDHRYLNDIIKTNPTAENIVLWIKQRIHEELKMKSNVSVCEGYKGEERASWVKG